MSRGRGQTATRLDRGFTLVEVLLAIVLVGILGAVAVVGVGSLTSSGTSAASSSSLDAVRTAANVHLATTGHAATTLGELVAAGELTMPSGAAIDDSGLRIVGPGWQLVYQADPQLALGCESTTTARTVDSLHAQIAAAYGLRRLSTIYAGPLIQVIRVADGASMDLGSNADGDLDTTALLAFAAGGDVEVQRWYDQSGRGAHMTAIGSTARPSIVIGGVLQTSAGRPTLRFDGAVSGDMLEAAGVAFTGAVTFEAVATRGVQTTDAGSCCRAIVATKQINANLEGVWLAVHREDWVGSTQAATAGYMSLNPGGVASASGSWPTGSTAIVGVAIDATTVRLDLGGSVVGSRTVTGVIGGNLTIGGERSSGARRFAGTISEVVVASAALTPSAMHALAVEQGSWFSIAVA